MSDAPNLMSAASLALHSETLIHTQARTSHLNPKAHQII